MHWRLLLSPPMSGADNMATDHALLELAQRHQVGYARVYSWVAPTISLGRHQTTVGKLDRAAIAGQGYGVVRRMTGGRAILHWREITYTIAAPIRDGELRHDYQNINRVLLAALGQLGVGAIEARPSGRTAVPGSAPCFEEPALGEIEFQGRKLVGSAQYRDGGAFVQHGSILVHDDQPLLLAVMPPLKRTLPPAGTLAAATGRDVTPAEFADAFFDAIRVRWDAQATALDVSDPELLDSTTAAARTYRDAEWTWRR